MAETRYEPTLPYSTAGMYSPYFDSSTTAGYSRSQLATAPGHCSDYEIDHSLYQRTQASPMAAPPASPWGSGSVSSYPNQTPTSYIFPQPSYTNYPWPPTPATPGNYAFDQSSSNAIHEYQQLPSSYPYPGLDYQVGPGPLSPTPEVLSSRSVSPTSAQSNRRRSSVGPSTRRHHSVGPPSRVTKPKPKVPRRDSSVGKRMSPGAKDKVDMVRDLGACWRCRRYKKSCDGPGECTNCSRGGFRVWPASLGCRRGCLEDLVAHILPVQAADVLGPAAKMTMKQPNWRFQGVDMELRRMIEERLPLANKWERLNLKVQSTQIFGAEFSALLDILVKHQESQSRPNPLLEASILLLDSTCDIYHNFVASAWPLQPAEITQAVASAQRGYASVCKMFLTSTLSGRGRDWLPSYLSMCMAFVGVMIMLDAAVAVPSHARQSLWGDVHALSKDLRMRLFPTITDLLCASTNGTKPYALSCWTFASPSPSAADQEHVRNAEGMRMVNGDKAAFDGMHRLQEWIRHNVGLIELGTKMLKSDPFTTPDIPCIAAVLRLFDV